LGEIEDGRLVVRVDSDHFPGLSLLLGFLGNWFLGFTLILTCTLMKAKEMNS